MDNYILTLLETTYMKEMKKNNPNFQLEDIFPYGWFSSNNIKFKTNVLNDAIKNNILIFETPLYRKNIDKIKKMR